MKKQDSASYSYSWWVPSLFILSTISLLIAGVFRNTLFNPYEKGFREDIGHLEHIDTLVHIGALTGSSNGLISANENALLHHARKTYSFGTTFSWLEAHPNSVQYFQGKMTFKSPTTIKQDKTAPSIDKLSFLKRKGLISFSPEGILLFHQDVFSKRVLGTSLGLHFITAKKKSKPFFLV